MSFLQVEGVRTFYGAQEILHGIDLAVPKGAILALLGRSGCGKTTLLRLIAGFDPASSGRITLAGVVLERPGLHVPAERRHIGYVPQEGTLFPHLNVAGNIGFGLSAAEIREGRVEEAMRLTGLGGLGRRMPHQISGGQQQRTALARALAPRPELILLDEPFNALDMALRRSVCADVVALLRSQSATAILVTHDPQEAFESADLIAVMRAGNIAQIADPATLYNQPVDAEVARMTGPVILLDSMLHGDHAVTPLGPVELYPGNPSSGPAQVLLRREQIVQTTANEGVEAIVINAVFRGDHVLARMHSGAIDFEMKLINQPIQPGCKLRVRPCGHAMAYASP
jgi:iron(III) transport system ATP-binding protein